MKNSKRGIWILSATALLAVAVMCALPAGAQRAAQPEVISNAVDSEELQADVSLPLRDIPGTLAPSYVAFVPARTARRPKLDQLKAAAQGKAAASAGQALQGPSIGAVVGVNVDGISGDPNYVGTAGTGCPNVSGVQLAPPDTNMAVGDTQVVQWVNICYAVFDKTTGVLLAGPFAGNQFWAGFGGACQFNNSGDPIIQWDKTNHVWLATQNTFGPFGTCIAVSNTADALGTYNRYFFSLSGFPDYVKWGLTPNIYYQTQNDFGFGGGFRGVNVCAYQADKMRAGARRVKQVCILDNSNGTLFDDSMLPADNDTAGGASSPEVLVGSIDNPGFNNAVFQYVFTVDFKHPRRATLAGVNGTMPIPVNTFDLACGGFGACIEQPSPGSELLDSLGDRLMYRFARREEGGNQSFVVTHSVTAGSGTAARWYEFTAPTGSTTLTLKQQGETPADTEFRWMGSIAKDKAGNLALGYSRSSGNAGDFPSLYLSGQTAGEAPGTTDAESLIFQGMGSQFSTANRWGDYSSMALDGADGCTFWFTTEYYSHDDSFAWNTRMASIKFPGCL